MMALIKENKFFYLFDSHARDCCGLPDPNGLALVMKFTDILEIECHLYSLSTKLNANFFEIVPIQLNECKVSLQETKHLKDRKYQKKRLSAETEHDKQVRLNKANEYKRQKLSKETDREKQIRLKKLNKTVQRKRSKETDSEKQTRLEKDRVYKKRKRANSRVLPSEHEINQQDYLNMFDDASNGGIEEQSWAKANIIKFCKSIQYVVCQCTVCKEAWPLKSKPRSPYVCS